jgi:hypothetical protein
MAVKADKEEAAVSSRTGAAGIDWGGSLRLKILGQPLSLKNNYVLRKSKKHNRTFILPNNAVEYYQESIRRQVPKRMPLLTGKLKISAMVYYANGLSDLDIEIVYDALQGRIYKNDRQLRTKFLDHAIDRHNPRVEILIEPRQAEMKLAPPAPKDACTDGTHLFSEYLDTVVVDGLQTIIARCPRCRAICEVPAMAKDRRELAP